MADTTLQPDPNNANRGTVRGLGQVERSLQQYGAGRSILASSDGVILAGNKTYDRAIELGIPVQEIESDGKTLFVIKRTDLDYDDPRAKELAIADNRASETGLEWDADVLTALADDGVDLSQFWFEDELAEVLAGDDESMGGNTDPDDVPEVEQGEPTTKRGDLWLLGKHRLLCGDSTVVTDVDRLMDGQKADMVFTDPPYGVAYQTKLSVEEAVARNRRTDGLEVANDALSADDTKAMLVDVFSLFPSVMKPGGAYYICSPGGDMETIFRVAIEESGLTLRQAIIWVKDVFVMGRQDYHWRHETILYGWNDGAAHYFIDDRTQSTVWEVPRPKVSVEHPTMKPIDLVAKAISNSTRPREVVVDFFGGSGTTLLACEPLGRSARVMELDPHYCDVIIRRWEDFTGEKAVLADADEQAAD